MKRFFCILMTAVMLTALFLVPAVAENDASLVTTPGQASDLVAVLFGEHPEALEGAYVLTPEMDAALRENGGWKEMADEMLAVLGGLNAAKDAYKGTVQGNTVFYVPCEFKKMSMDIVVVTENGAVAGLTTASYSGYTGEAGAFEEIGLSLPVPEISGELPGVLTLPEGEGPFPAVVLVHGSGRNERDETLFAQKPFRDIAEGLAEKGIAVYRYDKRTYVYPLECAEDRDATLMEETVNDAVTAVKLVAEQEKIDPERVFVLGHSLGGTAIPVINGCFDADAGVTPRGYILMAASPRGLNELMREQDDFLKSLLPVMLPSLQERDDAKKAELDRLDALYAADAETRAAMPDDEMIMDVYLPYWKWLADYDMIAEAEKITAPCLFLQGEEDFQVTMTDFEMLLNALRNGENRYFISYEGLIHTFAQGQKGDGPAAYARPEKVPSVVIDDIAAFILGN